MTGDNQRLSPLLETLICDLNAAIEPSVLPSTLEMENKVSLILAFS